MYIDSPIPGTTLKPGIEWLAVTRLLPEPRNPRDGGRFTPAPRRSLGLAQVLSLLTKP